MHDFKDSSTALLIYSISGYNKNTNKTFQLFSGLVLFVYYVGEKGNALKNKKTKLICELTGLTELSIQLNLIGL